MSLDIEELKKEVDAEYPKHREWLNFAILILFLVGLGSISSEIIGDTYEIKSLLIGVGAIIAGFGVYKRKKIGFYLGILLFGLDFFVALIAFILMNFQITLEGVVYVLRDIFLIWILWSNKID